MTTLLTDRLTLTPVQASDFTDLCDLFGDIAFSGPIFGRTLGPEEVWFRALRDIGHWSALGYGNWSARLKNGGDLVGTIGVLNYRRDLAPAFDAPELGWGVAPRFQGQGLAFEGLSAALAWCDDTLMVPRTVCMIAPDNAPSHALAVRAGYAAYAETTYKDAPVVLLDRFAA